MTTANALLSGLALLAALMVLTPLISPPGFFRREPKSDPQGQYVAEVWLQWYFGRGSTMFRERYATLDQAAHAVKRRAKILDAKLPKFYVDTDWSGRKILLEHEFGIEFGVRQITPQESERFRPVWTTSMPGERGYAGEHSSAHPLLIDNTNKLSIDGYKT